VGSRDRVANGIDEFGIQRTGLGQMIDGLAFVEAGHFDRIFDRFPVTFDAERSVVALRDRDDAMVDLRREMTVYPYLFVAGDFPLRQGRVVQIGKMDGALDLQRAAAFEKDRRGMGIDATDKRMRCRVRQKCEDSFLGQGVGCH
jgi:hypothetical protein